MRYEFQKVLSNFYVKLIFIFLISLNVWLFYSHCTDDSNGYTLTQVQEKYENPEKQIFPEDQFYYEQWVTKEVEERKEIQKSYPEFLKKLQTEMDLKVNSGLFGDSQGFSVRAIHKTKELYHELENLKVETVFTGGIEVFFNWKISDICILISGALFSLILVTQEKRKGILLLLRPMKNGHLVLYGKKIASMSVMVIICTIIIYGSDFLISGILFNQRYLFYPIQLAKGFQSCPYALTGMEYVLLFITFKLIWNLSICIILFALCCLIHRISWIVLGVVLGIVISVLCSYSSIMWLRTISFAYIENTETFFETCIFLNFFGIPIRQLYVVIIFLILLLVLFTGIGAWAFIKRPVVMSVNSKKSSKLEGVYRHTNLTLHEGIKILWLNGTVFILILFIGIQYFSYRVYEVEQSEMDYYYKEYSEKLSGAPSLRSEELIRKETKRFEEIQTQMQNYLDYAGNDTKLADMLTSELMNEIKEQSAFEKAKLQYENLHQGQSYVYQTGYERMFGKEGIKESLTNTMKLFLILILILSGVYAEEKESNVEVLLNTMGVKKKVLNRKIFYIGIIILITFAIAYLPQYIAIEKLYGLPEIYSMASCLNAFHNLRWNWSILTIIIVQNIIRFIVLIVAAVIISVLSEKTGNKITTIMLSMCILILPIVVILLIL